jgi:hypothetical protein
MLHYSQADFSSAMELVLAAGVKLIMLFVSSERGKSRKTKYTQKGMLFCMFCR